MAVTCSTSPGMGSLSVVESNPMAEVQNGFERTKRWVLAAASGSDAKGTSDEPGIDALSQGELESLAACLDDIKDHLLSGYTKLSDVFMDSPNMDELDTCLADTEVQLALAVRNWRELTKLLRSAGIWHDD